MLTTDRPQPTLSTTDLKATLRSSRRERDEGRAAGRDVSSIERDIVQLERVLAAFTSR
jgi:hypothetical protein